MIRKILLSLTLVLGAAVMGLVAQPGSAQATIGSYIPQIDVANPNVKKVHRRYRRYRRCYWRYGRRYCRWFRRYIPHRHYRRYYPRRRYYRRHRCYWRYGRRYCY